MIARAMVLLVALVLVSSGSAYGANVLVSGALPVNGGEKNHCTIVNTTAKSIAVSFELVNDSGSASPIGSCASLAANAICHGTVGIAEGDAGNWYCRATVTGASKASVRGELCNLNTYQCSQLR